MRNFLRSTFSVTSALILGVTLIVPRSAVAQGTGPATGNALPDLPGTLSISEFRFDGPGGTGDEFIEVCNSRRPSSVGGGTFTVESEDNSGGLGIFAFDLEGDDNTVGGGDVEGDEEPILIDFIPDGTVFQPGDCYLFAGPEYSLAGYPGGEPDSTYDEDISEDSGIILLGSNNVTYAPTDQQPGFLSVESPDVTQRISRLDAVGFNRRATITFPGTESPRANLFREGDGLIPIGPTAPGDADTDIPPGNPTQTVAGQYSFIRSQIPATAVKNDSGDNVPDFYGSRPVSPLSYSTSRAEEAPSGGVVFSSFGGLQAAVVAILGAAGPESRGVGGVNPVGATAPRDRFSDNTEFVVSNFDTSAAAGSAPNRERFFAVPRGEDDTPGSGDASIPEEPDNNNEATSPRGIFLVRFTYRNNTGGPIARLRWRMVELTTDNRGAVSGISSNQAVFRLIDSETARVFVGAGRDQDCRSTSTTTPCAGQGFKLVQGLVVENSAGVDPDPGAIGVDQGTPNALIPDPGPAGTNEGGVAGGLNSGLTLENNQGFAPQTDTLAGAGVIPVAGVPTGSGSIPSSAFLRGSGTLVLANDLANQESISVEFRFGVRLPGTFRIGIVVEGDEFDDEGITPPDVIIPATAGVRRKQ